MHDLDARMRSIARCPGSFVSKMNALYGEDAWGCYECGAAQLLSPDDFGPDEEAVCYDVLTGRWLITTRHAWYDTNY